MADINLFLIIQTPYLQKSTNLRNFQRIDSFTDSINIIFFFSTLINVNNRQDILGGSSVEGTQRRRF